MLSPQMAVHIVQHAEKHNENAALSDDPNKVWINPSKCLVEKALERWSNTKMRADNTSVITLLLDPPGPPRAQVLQNRKRKAYPDSGLEIVTRYEGDLPMAPKRTCIDNIQDKRIDKSIQVDLCEKDSGIFSASDILRRMSAEHAVKNSPILQTIMQDKHSSSTVNSSICEVGTSTDDLDRAFVPRTRESTSFDPREANHSSTSEKLGESEKTCVLNKELSKNDENVQINEISSSSNDVDDEQSEKEQIVPSTKAKNKKFTEQTERPVLRSRNSKSTVEQKNSLVKNTRKMCPKQKETRSDLERENSGDTPRQLRIRHTTIQKPDSSKPSKKLTAQTKQDQNQNVAFKKSTVAVKATTSNCTKVEWINASMFRSIIKHKNSLNAKTPNQKGRNVLKMRGRLKDSLQMELKQTKQQERIEDNLRRSLRHTDQENVKRIEKKVKKDETVVKRGRGRPHGSKNRAKYQPVRRTERTSLDRLRTRLGR
ncbi:hypothetical protein ILUMI_23323 [Ignelater luminosus]|uniref:Uncharacterized protein n=1 Tax=Ignelater luminosus TaxID=2038154 RepID=A0A8K0G1Q0_IGNLU|nr:hypothetical protein ILUMI_23323 [Ignelater luminosus]